jgi:hypothetical protein
MLLICGPMKSRYAIVLLSLSSIMAILSLLAQQMNWLQIPWYTWLGLAYLTTITLLIHGFVQAAKENPNSVIRRLMVGSMLRMFLGILFLAITLFNVKPVNLHFVILYCIYFCVFMVFEISQMRTNLRPDLKQRPNNGNA